MRALVVLMIFFSSVLITAPTVALADSPADSFWCQWFGWILPACTAAVAEEIESEELVIEESPAQEGVNPDQAELEPAENSEEEVMGVVAEPVEETPEAEPIVEEEIEEVAEVEVADAPAPVEETI